MQINQSCTRFFVLILSSDGQPFHADDFKSRVSRDDPYVTTMIAALFL